MDQKLVHKPHHESSTQHHILKAMESGIRACLILTGVLFFACILFLKSATDASAQPRQVDEPPIINLGDAVVTGFSGITALRPRPNTKLEDYIIINTQAPSLQVFGLSQMFGPDNSRLVQAPRIHTVPALRIGQVFGVTLDDGLDPNGRPTGKNPVANIYATASSAYGLHLVETKRTGNQLVRERAKKGSPQVSWMDGQFGPGGGPGTIWKIDGRTGQVSLFANVTLNGAANSGPALGAITFDPKTRRLFVSDLQTGMIHSFDLKGREVARFDHGTEGRTRQGLPAVAFNPAVQIPITSPAFNAEISASWGYADKARQVWGLGVHGGRLYYAATEGPDIWSVGLTKRGGFAKDARVEVEVLSNNGDPVSAITFGRDGTMYLSQRGRTVPAYNYKVMANPGTAELLRYQRRTLPSGRKAWEPAPKGYAVGHSQAYRSGNGGVALGYGYDQNGYMRYDICEGTVWSTGEILRQSAAPDPRLTAGGQTIVHGLQGNSIKLVKPANVGPFKAFFIDFDSNHADPGHRGHMGEVAIWRKCAGKPAPKKPVGPRIRITKSCSAAALNIDMHCRITLTSTGSVAPKGPVGFSDIGTVLKGPSFASKNPWIFSADVDDIAWTCSDLPDDKLTCSIPGKVMKPGQSRSIDILMDISEVVGTPDWLIRNCATLTGTRKTSCVTRGDGDTLITTKFSANQQPCIAGGPCDFEVAVFNPGKRTFDGDLFLADNLTIGGASVSGITVDAVFPQNGCDIRGLTLPLQWQCHVTIPPGGERVFNIQLTIPKSAVPPGVTQGRNCFVATDPHLALGGGGLPNHFWNNMLDPANTNFQPGRDCVNFDILPTGIIPPRPPGIPFGAKMQLSAKPKPSVFSKAGQIITYAYKVLNSGIVPITSIKLTDNKAVGIKCPKFSGGTLAPGASVKCVGTYRTKPGDVGKDIKSTAKLTGKTATGTVPTIPPAHATVKFNAVATVSLQVTPIPSTFSKAGEKILYRYIIRNTGAAPVTSTALKDNRVTKFTCRPSGGAVPVGGTTICTGTYTTKPGDVGKDITSTASITGKTASGTVKSLPPVNSVVKFIKPKTVAKPPPAPAISIVNKVSPGTYTAANQTIAIEYTITNKGNVPLTKFEMTGAIVGQNIKCPPANTDRNGGAIAVGASVTCIGSYKTTASDINSGRAHLWGEIVGYTASGVSVPAPNIAKAVVKYVKPKPVGKPKLKIASYYVEHPKSGTFSAANEEISYTYQITNIGNVPVTSFTVSDSKATGIRCATFTTQGKHVTVNAASTATGRNLPPNRGLLCSGNYTTKAGDVGRNIVSTASVTGVWKGGAVPPPPTATATVKYVKPKPAPKPSLSLAVKPSPGTFSAAGQTITYIYTLANTGNVLFKTFGLGDKLSGLRGPECPPGKSAKGGPLAPGASATCLATYTTKPGDLGRDIVTNPIAFAKPAKGRDVDAPPASAVVRFAGKPGMTLKHTCNPKTYTAAGQAINCSFTVTNSGTIPIRSCQITGSRINVSCPPGVIPPGASILVQGSYSTNAGDIGKNIVMDFKLDGITQ